MDCNHCGETAITFIEHFQQNFSRFSHEQIATRSIRVDRVVIITGKDSRVGRTFGEGGIVDLCEGVDTDITDVVERHMVIVYCARIVKGFNA